MHVSIFLVLSPFFYMFLLSSIDFQHLYFFFGLSFYMFLLSSMDFQQRVLQSSLDLNLFHARFHFPCSFPSMIECQLFKNSNHLHRFYYKKNKDRPLNLRIFNPFLKSSVHNCTTHGSNAQLKVSFHP